MHVRTAVSSPAEHPIAEASVLMDCPQVFKGSGLSLLGKTDARGELDHREHPWGRWIHDDCDLVVEQPGFAPRRFPVADVCLEYDLNHCVRVDLHVRLVPRRRGADGPPPLDGWSRSRRTSATSIRWITSSLGDLVGTT